MPFLLPETRNEQDLAICDLLIGLLFEVERYGMLGAFPAPELARWLQHRTVAFCNARREGAQDDAPVMTRRHLSRCRGRTAGGELADLLKSSAARARARTGSSSK